MQTHEATHTLLDAEDFLTTADFDQPAGWRETPETKPLPAPHAEGRWTPPLAPVRHDFLLMCALPELAPGITDCL